MELKDIQTFVVVAQLGTMSAASKHLYVTQPAVSVRIQRIEKEIGCQIFERIGQKVKLTPSGQVFYTRCLSILSDLNEAIREARVANNHPGFFTIGMAESMSSKYFAKRFQEFTALNPDIVLNLRISQNDQISNLIENGLIDVGFRYFMDHHTHNIEQIKVASEQFVVVSSYHSKLVPESCSIHDFIRNINWVTFPSRSHSDETVSKLLDSLLTMNNIGKGALIEAESLTAQKRLVESDLGLGFLPKSFIEEELELRSLRIIDIPELSVKVPIFAIYRLSSSVVETIERFVDLISV
ncbi:LysR family transcriptional regulator [Brevibacillus sp. GCM10020057]|uniref:LysR family transcriptional regulator n=1 Tax=Brevibacillus sp. GCM10020057 TaxID=3317327 RepID=UPI00363FB06E